MNNIIVLYRFGRHEMFGFGTIIIILQKNKKEYTRNINLYMLYSPSIPSCPDRMPNEIEGSPRIIISCVQYRIA